MKVCRASSWKGNGKDKSIDIYLIRLINCVEIQSVKLSEKSRLGKNLANKSEYKSPPAFSLCLFLSSSLSRQAGSLGINIFIYFTSLFLTERQSWYAMNRFLYILITPTSCCESGSAWIWSPSGLVSFHTQIVYAAAQACALVKRNTEFQFQALLSGSCFYHTNTAIDFAATPTTEEAAVRFFK